MHGVRLRRARLKPNKKPWGIAHAVVTSVQLCAGQGKLHEFIQSVNCCSFNMVKVFSNNEKGNGHGRSLRSVNAGWILSYHFP